MPITIKDIAKDLGISASTVSRILNGKSLRNHDLVEKVRAKAKEVNYTVNTAAASLRTNKSRLIGMVVPEISNDFFSEILSGAEEVAELQGYNLLICQSNESSEKERKLIHSLIACNVDGILISCSTGSTYGDGVVEEALAEGKKVVYFDRVPEGSGLPYVTVQDFEGGLLVTEHLIAQGRKKILYHGLAPELTNDESRLRGVNQALRNAGYDPAQTYYSDNLDELTKLILTGDIDALICYNDGIAALDIAHLRRAGFNLPEQLAISGFDNRTICNLISPTLTTIEHSTYDLGRSAIEMMISMLETENHPDNVLFPARLIIRESTTFIK